MNYEINVAKKNANGEYHHWFATAERSIDTEAKLIKVLKEFRVAFPAPEYNISASRWEETGYGIDIEKLLEVPPVSIKVKDLRSGFRLFGNKGAVYSNKCHICESGSSVTLCGSPMLSHNSAKSEGVDEVGCIECINIYTEMIKSGNNEV